MAFNANTAPTLPLWRSSCNARRAASMFRATTADNASPSATCTATRFSASISINSPREPRAPSTSRSAAELVLLASSANCNASARAAEMLASLCAVPYKLCAPSRVTSAETRAWSASTRRCASSASLRTSVATTLRKRSMSSFSPRTCAFSAPTFSVAWRASSSVAVWSPPTPPLALTASYELICSTTLASSPRRFAASASRVAITPESIS